MSNLRGFRSGVKLESQVHSSARTCDSLWIYRRSATKVRQNYVSGPALNHTGSHSCSTAAAELQQIYYRFTVELQQDGTFLNRRIGVYAENIRYSCK